MKRYVTLKNGIAVADVYTDAKMKESSDLVRFDAVDDVMGMRWNGAEFEPVPESKRDAAMRKLERLDKESGMSRLMRETLLAIAGSSAPARLSEVEQDAQQARADL